MRILVLGAGAIGGYFGGRLAESGADVTFLVRPRRQAQLVRDGLRITSPLGDIDRPVNPVTADQLRSGFDLILLTCKSYDLESAMDDIAAAMLGGCTVLPMLNGMAHLRALDARFDRSNVMGGTCMIDTQLQADGVIRHGGTLQRLVFGERDGSESARSAQFATLLAKTTIDYELADDIEQRMWDKIVFLSALAATTCLFRANVAEINAAAGGTATMQRVLDANVAIAAAEGHPLGAEAIDFARRRLTDATGEWSASLLRDLEAGGRIEGDHIVGWMLDRARTHGVDDTVLAMAYTALKAYEERRDRRGGGGGDQGRKT